VAKDLKDGVEKILPPRKPPETVEQVLARAKKRVEELEPDSEPLPGTAVPDGWPRFNVGDEVGPVKGWWMEVASVDVIAQTITLKPKRSAKRVRKTTRRKRRIGAHR